MKRHSKEDTNKKQEEIPRNMNTRYKRTCATKKKHENNKQGRDDEEQSLDSKQNKEKTRKLIARKKAHKKQTQRGDYAGNQSDFEKTKGYMKTYSEEEENRNEFARKRSGTQRKIFIQK